MKGRLWSKEEIDFLHENVGFDEVNEVIKKFLKQWSDRTPEAILTKIKRLGLSRIPIDDGWNCTGLAEILGCNRDRVHDWIDRGLLKTRRRPGRRHHRIMLRDFANFAASHPDWLKDIDLDRLRILLDEKSISKIESSPERTRGVRFRLRSSRTGRTYDSLREAARSEYFSRKTIKRSIELKKSTRDGFAYEFLDRCPSRSY